MYPIIVVTGNTTEDPVPAEVNPILSISPSCRLRADSDQDSESNLQGTLADIPSVALDLDTRMDPVVVYFLNVTVRLFVAFAAKFIASNTMTIFVILRA